MATLSPALVTVMGFSANLDADAARARSRGPPGRAKSLLSLSISTAGLARASSITSGESSDDLSTFGDARSCASSEGSAQEPSLERHCSAEDAPSPAVAIPYTR